jgi:O-antigen ligase
MDLISVILFLVLYYLRPQEWSGMFAKIHFVQLIMIFGLATLFFRARSIRGNELLRTPHDWLMLLFFGWVVANAASPWDCFWDYMLPLAVFYIVIVHTLTSTKRISIFVGWWTFLIVAVAALAIASEFGFDPRDSASITHGRMKGRLVFNLSIFKNPNALGHSVVPAIPMLYYFCVWKRPLVIKQVGFAALFIPLYCIYLTVSKGSYLAGSAATLATLTFGRPKWVQILIISLAIGVGGGALWALPRMQELKKSKTDEAIQGRVAAFTHGLRVIKADWNGIGHYQWMRSFWDAHHYSKAAHSSYVQIGAELGYPGFFLFFCICYCNLRTLITARSENNEEERIRRVLFVLVVCYMVSSWMVDFGYRPTFFMFTAAIAAYHRLLNGITAQIQSEQVATATEETAAALPSWRARILPQPAMENALAMANAQSPAPLLAGTGGTPAIYSLDRAAQEREEKAETPPPGRIGRGWNRFSWIDATVAAAMTYAAVRFWQIAINRM